MNHRDILKNALRQNLLEKPATFDAVTDLIERCAGLVKELGGLQAAEISDLDRARIGQLVEQQVQIGIERGDFDFVFRTPAPIVVPEFQIARLELKPGDTVVVKSSQDLCVDYVEHIKHMARVNFPDHRLLIMAPNLELFVMAKVQS